MAATVYNLLVATPQDWSTRVGLFGAWGEGKTTICKFVERLARSDGHIVLWLDPWTARSIDELLATFTLRLIDGLKAAGLSVKGTAFAQFLGKAQKMTEPVQRLAEINNIAKAGVGAGITLMNRFKADRLLIDRIRRQFPAKRVIIVIDDLDRAKPDLIPTLLLSLRELLDLPRFSFLLPFDPKIVSSALAEEHPAWVSGDRFLEKITDFRYRLPTPTVEQCRRLFLADLEAHCPFVPRDAIHSFLDLLPGNPRRIKMVVRSLAMLKDEVARHGEGELDWPLILFASLVRIESDAFLNAYVDDVFGEENVWLQLAMDKDQAEEKHRKKVEQVCDNTAIDEKDTRQRLMRLCEAIRERSPLESAVKVRYHCELLTRPHAVTWREFEMLLATAHDVSAAEAWLQKHAAKRHLDMDAVLDELFRTLVMFYDHQLAAASNTNTLVNHDAEMAHADKALRLLGDLIDGKIAAPISRRLIEEPSHFEAFLKVALKWAHFDVNLADGSARDAEKAALANWLNTVSDDMLPLLADLVIDRHESPIEHEDAGSLKKCLLQECENRLAILVVTKLQIPDGMREFRNGGRHMATRPLLLDPAGPVWTGRTGQRVYEVLSSASTNHIVQENAQAWLKLVCSDGIGTYTRDMSQTFIKDIHPVSALWKAAIACQLQFRALSEMRVLREQLIGCGANEAALPIPDWLED
ncbi:MAG: hypothetical protein IPK66_06460 [Rhodospirillales bacterium]|nr:hypothetical protein [Rhodospirillales bacterium]